MPNIRDMKIPEIIRHPKVVPAIFDPFSRLPRPISRLRLAAPPNPNRIATAVQMIEIGYATLVAAFPRSPTFCPIKI